MEIKKIIIKTRIPNKIIEIYTKRAYKIITKNLRIYSLKNILDVGGGSGELINQIKKRLGDGLEYYVIDIDLKSLNKNKKKYKNINFLEGDVEKIPFKSNYFDLVICKDVLHHCKNPEKAVKEIKRVGKTYIIIEARRGDKWLDSFLKEHNHFSEKKFKNITNAKKYYFIDVLWPRLKYMVFLILFPKILKSRKAFMVATNIN